MTLHRWFDQHLCPILSQARKVSPSRFFLFILLYLLSGCLQEAPAPSAERTVALLTSLLHDEGPEVRRTAVESLGKIGDRASAVSVLPLLTDSVPAVRAAAAQALGRMGSSSTEEIIVGLTRALEDPDDSVKTAAAIAIGEIEPDSVQLVSVVDLVHAPDVRVRRVAVRALLQADASRWVSALAPALRDADAEVRQGAVAATGVSGGPAAATEIWKRLTEDPSPAVRAEAAYQAGKMGGSEIRSALEGVAANDSDSGVRLWAEGELRSLRGNE